MSLSPLLSCGLFGVGTLLGFKSVCPTLWKFNGSSHGDGFVVAILQSEVELILKNAFIRASGVAQVVECLPSKCEALSSNPTIAKNLFVESVNECVCERVRSPACFGHFNLFSND
jgi:hypothetical protein